MAYIYLCSLILFALAEGFPVDREEDLISTGITFTRPDAYNVVAQKGNPLLLNCSVGSNGTARFSWYKDGEPLDLSNQRRVQVVNGSLSFKRVLFRRKKNVTDEGVYECHVRNQIGSIIAKRVKVVIAGIAKSYTEDPQSQEVPLGGVARFHCEIQSTPPPFYLWQKEDRKQIREGPRYIILPSGTLQLLDVRQEDAGDYRCSATGGELHKLPDQVDSLPWKRSNAATLRVISASGRREVTFVAVPAQNTSVEKGKSVILECLADGNPRPHITWYRKDKKPLPHSKMVGGNLRLINVDMDDAGVYVCGVNGTISGRMPETLLTVTTKPVILKKPFNHKYPKTRTSRFACEFAGMPQPKVTWYFNGQQIKNEGRYKVENKVGLKSELVVVNTELSDSGYYQCVGENELGYDMGVARLEIYTGKNPPGLPRNVTAFALDQHTINVYWNNSQTSEPILAYTVEYAVSDNPGKQIQSMVVNGKTSAKIEGLRPYTEYAISIRGYASNSGAGPKSDLIKARTLPSKPSKLPVIREASTTSNSINIEWEDLAPEDRMGVITGHLIEYRHASDTQTHTKEVSGAARSYLISGLTPNTLYKIRVKAGTEMGYPNPPSDSQWVEYRTAGNTNASANDTVPRPPTNFSVVKVSPSEVNVTWKSLQEEVPVTGYTLSVTKLTGSSQGPQKYQISDPDQSWIKLNNLENKTSYQFVLVANSPLGPSDPVVEEYSPSLPPPPSDLRVLNRTSTAMLLAWSPTPGLAPGEGLQYEVRYQPLTFAMDKEVILKTTQSSLWVRDMKPYTKYRCDVRTVSDGEKGRWSSPIINLTLEGVPSEPRELQGQILEGGIFITWKPPAEPNGNITTYLVMYQILTSTQNLNHWEIKSVNGSLTSATIEELQRGLYRIMLKACTNAGPGPPTDPMEISDINMPQPQPKPSSQEDQKLGIILGVSIGVACIIICILIIMFRNRCFATPQSHITQPAYLHANGHAGGRGNGHVIRAGLNEYQLETCTPMLSSIPGENEHSDSKGCGSGNIIVTPNGSRINGYVPFKNGMKNGHISNGHMTTFVGYANLGSMEERRGLIAAMLSGSEVSHVSEDPTSLDKAPDRDSLLDGIDKSLEDTEDSNKSLNEQDSSIQNLPPDVSDDVRQPIAPSHRDVVAQNTSESVATATTCQGEIVSPSHPSLRGYHCKLPTSPEERKHGGSVVASSPSTSVTSNPPPPPPPPHYSHQGQPRDKQKGQNKGRGPYPEGKVQDLPTSTCNGHSHGTPRSIHEEPHTKYTSSQERIFTGQRRGDLLRQNAPKVSKGGKGAPNDRGHLRRTADVSV